MRKRRAHEDRFERTFAILIYVVGVAAVTAQQAVIFQPLHACTEPAGCHLESSAARATARRMEAYPVQRQRLPEIPSSICSGVGSGCSFSRPTTDITNPGVQKPHCRPWVSWNACCTGWSGAPSAARPSIVV